jgi:hypothetical protein
MGNALHIICERDVGLFSLIQQVISNIPWAIREGRTPVVCYRDRTCYWTPDGYAGKSTVWEYYFEPVFEGYSAADIPPAILKEISSNHPSPIEPGYPVGGESFVTAHFGDHPDLENLTLRIPFELEDPTPAVRIEAHEIIKQFVHPRKYIQRKVDRFLAENVGKRPIIGVHVRGTDATSAKEERAYREGSLDLNRYEQEIEKQAKIWPTAKILVATDDKSSLDRLRSRFGDRVISYATILHQQGEPASEGPTGWIMPAYIAGDRNTAARNGEEAVIEYLLLSHSCHLVHNGASLARTVLLNAPRLAHTNTHSKANQAIQTPQMPARRLRMRERLKKAKMATSEPPVAAEIIEKVKAEKAKRRASKVRYIDFPSVGFIVQSFNRVSNLDHIYQRLSSIGDCDLIVCDDGSIDGSRHKWAEHLSGPNDFLILSNDLHEIRILDRAIRFSRADIVCVVQDDDRIPSDRSWLDDVQGWFDAVPDLAIVGGFMGFRGIAGNNDGHESIWGAMPFQFVLHVNIGPYFIRRNAYEALGGWDYSFSKVGEPGICFDNELCLRAWKNGYKVGYYFVPFKGPAKHYACDGGTALFSGTRRRLNMRRNQRATAKKYQGQLAHLEQLVDRANADLAVKLNDPAEQVTG